MRDQVLIAQLGPGLFLSAWLELQVSEHSAGKLGTAAHTYNSSRGRRTAHI